MFLKIINNQIFSPCRVTLLIFTITLPWPNYAVQPNFNQGAADPNVHSTSEPSNQLSAKSKIDTKKPISHPELFGLIEIGTKGVKSIVVEIESVEREKNCSEDNTELTDLSIKYSLEPHNTNPGKKASMEDTVKKARNFFDEMTNKLSVDSRQIYLVGGISDISLFPHRDELKKALEEGLANGIQMDLVTPEKEAEWSFHEVLKMIPEPYRARRKNEVVVLDIGSGYAKSGYLEEYGGEEEIISAVVPWGTQTFTDEVHKSNKSQVAFHQVAKKLQQDTLFPMIDDKLSSKPGFVNRTRVYLIGGIAWATSTLVHPNDNRPFPVINVRDFDTLYKQAILPNAAANLYSVDAMSKYPAIEKVRKAFTPDNIVAGLEILKAFSDEMRFKDKKMFFIRDSLYAWPKGYILDRCKKDKTCCNSLL